MYLRCLTHQKPHQWDKWLAMAEWWYNTSHHSALNLTPYKALYGKNPPSINYHQAIHTKNECVDSFLRQRAELQVLLKKNLLKAQERMTYYANKHRSEQTFEVGDKVFLKAQAFRQFSLKNTKDTKLSAKYYGPFKILKKIGPVAYRLELPTTVRIHDTFHVSLLKRKNGNHQQILPTLPEIPAPAKEKQPAKILDRRLIKKNNAPAASVLIQCKDSVPEDATWEDWVNIQRRFP